MTKPSNVDRFIAGAEPNDAERLVITACDSGEIANLADLSEDQRTISADLLAALVTGTFVHPDWEDWTLHQDGPKIAYATVAGPVKLALHTLPRGLRLVHCQLAAIDLTGATVGGDLMLNSCQVSARFDLASATIVGDFSANEAVFSNESDDAIYAQGVKAAGWFMRKATVKGRFAINGAELSGPFSAVEAVFSSESDDAIYAQGVKAAGWFVRKATVKGRFAINSAELSGQFSANEAVFSNEGGDSIRAQGVKATDWFMDKAKVKGRFDINSAELNGQFGADEAQFSNEGGDAIWAQGVKAAGWFMRKATVQGRFAIISAELSGQFSANEAVLSNERGDSIGAQGVKATDWFMDKVKVKGRFDINSAELNGQFSADEAQFSNEGGDAIWAQGVKAAGWFMRKATVQGRFDINNAELSGWFSASEAEFSNEGRAAIRAQRVRAAGWFMNKATVKGRFDINSAVLGGQFSANEAEFSNERGDAIWAQSVKAADWFMDMATVKGRFAINSAELSGQFCAENAEFECAHATGIDAPYARFSGGIFLRGEDTQVRGGIVLSYAKVEQLLDLRGLQVTGRNGSTSVDATKLVVIGDAHLGGTRLEGGLDATGSHFQGRLDLATARLACPSRAEALAPNWSNRHHALILREARIEGRLVMPIKTPEGIVDLSHAHCTILEDNATGWPAPLTPGAPSCDDRLCIEEDGRKVDIQHLVLDGLHYGHFEHPGGDPAGKGNVASARKHWLAAQSADDLRRHFNPQPWRQASSVLRGMGYDQAAQALSIERRVRERLADNTPWFQQAVSWFLHVVADYGFNPWRTVGISFAVILIFAAIYGVGVTTCGAPNRPEMLGTCGGQAAYIATQIGDMDATAAKAGGYPTFDPIAYSLGAFVPLFDLATEPYWRPNFEASHILRVPIWFGELTATPREAPAFHIPVGALLYWLFVLERFVGAILLAIAVTGFTGLLTRDER